MLVGVRRPGLSGVCGAECHNDGHLLHRPDEGGPDFCRRLRDDDPGLAQSSHLGGGCAFATGNDRSGVPHAATGRRRGAGDEGSHRLAAMLPDPGGGFLLPNEVGLKATFAAVRAA